MKRKSNAVALLLAAGVLALGAAAQAQVTETMNFVGVNSGTSTGAAVENFYNGGTSSTGNSFSQNLGVAYGIDAVAENSLNSTTNFLDNPSASTAVMYFKYLSSTNTAYTADNSMNVAGGFTSLAFNYASSGAYNSSGSGTPSVSLYSGLNGTGTLLATINLTLNDPTGDGCATGKYCVWNSASTTLAAGQVAQSAVFSKASEYTLFDAVQISAVPEPSSFALAAAGLVAVAGALRLRRRASEN